MNYREVVLTSELGGTKVVALRHAGSLRSTLVTTNYGYLQIKQSGWQEKWASRASVSAN